MFKSSKAINSTQQQLCGEWTNILVAFTEHQCVCSKDELTDFLVILVCFYLIFISMWLKVLAAHLPLDCRDCGGSPTVLSEVFLQSNLPCPTTKDLICPWRFGRSSVEASTVHWMTWTMTAWHSSVLIILYYIITIFIIWRMTERESNKNEKMLKKSSALRILVILYCIWTMIFNWK